jgi:hypothetical protein
MLFRLQFFFFMFAALLLPSRAFGAVPCAGLAPPRGGAADAWGGRAAELTDVECRQAPEAPLTEGGHPKKPFQSTAPLSSQVAVGKLKAVHARTHPGAQLRPCALAERAERPSGALRPSDP